MFHEWQRQLLGQRGDGEFLPYLESGIDLSQNKYETRRQTQRDIFEYIKVFYNRERLHSSLGYYSPEEYEMLMSEKVS